jgi:hypothetical protein
MEDEQISHNIQSPHLSQNVVDIGVFIDLRKFLETAAFNNPVEGLQKCKDEGLPKACGSLITALGFKDKVIITS